MSRYLINSLLLAGAFLVVGSAAHAGESAIEKARGLVRGDDQAKALLAPMLKEHDDKLRAANSEKATAEAKQATAEAKQVTAEQAKDSAESATKTAEESLDNKAIAFDVAVSGKLIESGISAGVAALVDVPLKRDWGQSRIESGHNRQISPYVVVIPRYLVDWFGGSPERSRYCASRWTTDAEQGQRAADALAKKRGEHMADLLIERVKGGVGTHAKILDRVLEDVPEADLSELREALLRLAKAGLDIDDDKRKLARAALAGMLAERVLDWTPGVPTSCAQYSVGIWVNPFPSTSKIDVRNGRKPGEIQEVEVRRWASFGIAWVPSAYVSLLGGLSYGSAYIDHEVELGANQTDSVIRYWSASVGLSINADAISALK